MIYKTYGKTGKRVSAVGFGGMRFDTTRPQEENAELLHYAQSKGINYFDTAPGYCQDTSEDIFGLALRDMKGDFFLSTKGNPESVDTAEKAVELLKRSLERLGVDKIDFYHIWCLRKMEHYDLAMRPGGQYEGLLRCQEEGLIDHIVVSSHQPGHEIRQVVTDGKAEGILLGVNLLNFPYRWDGVMAAYESGWGVVAMNPLSGGLIPTHEDKLQFLASDQDTPTEAALRFVIACPQITIALNGFTNKEHIDMACRVADRAKPLTDEDLERIRSEIGDNMNDACTGCGYCWDCPQQIPVPGYMQVYNEKHVFGASDEEMKKKMYGELNWGMLVGAEAHAADCIECGKCERECTQHLPIIERLKEMTAWERDSL